MRHYLHGWRCWFEWRWETFTACPVVNGQVVVPAGKSSNVGAWSSQPTACKSAASHWYARFVAGLVRRARKYYLGVSIISQQANDFLKNDYGRAIASQSSLRILMKQDTTTIKNVTTEFNLSEFEANYLITCGRGDALIIADQNHVAVKVVASSKEHPLITTNPAELYKP